MTIGVQATVMAGANLLAPVVTATPSASGAVTGTPRSTR